MAPLPLRLLLRGRLEQHALEDLFAVDHLLNRRARDEAVHDDISPLPDTEAAVYRLVVSGEIVRYANQKMMKKPVPEYTRRGSEGGGRRWGEESVIKWVKRLI
jgi:hypothetical protein